MNVNDIFPTRFVKAHDLGDKQVTVTIKAATMEEMGHGTEKESKLCLWFEKATKGFVLNKTNAMIIASMYGPETDAWIGEQITIFAARVKAFGSWQDAVRVKEQIPARNVNRQPIPDTMQEPPPIDDENDLLDVDEGQNAPQATQTPATPSNGETGQNGTSRKVDAETGEITNGDVIFAPVGEAHETPPHNRMWGIGMSILGQDWDMARPWIMRQWTKLVTPDNIRSSSSELSEDEKTLLGDYLNENASNVQRTWPKQKAQMMQATNNDKVTA